MCWKDRDSQTRLLRDCLGTLGWEKSSIQRLSIASLYEEDFGAPGHGGDLHVKVRVEITGQSG